MSTPKKMAALHLSAEQMAQMLHLPDGAEVAAIEAIPCCRGLFRVIVEGAGWETGVGQPIQPAMQPMITDHFDADGLLVKREVAWALPED